MKNLSQASEIRHAKRLVTESYSCRIKIPKGDLNFAKNLCNILEFGYSDEGQKVRPRWKDGKPAYTKFILNKQEEYDLSKGEFPTTILRRIPVKSGIGEILWIYRDTSSDLDLLKNKYGVTWWDAWDIGDRTIGFRYGKTVREHNMFQRLLQNLKEQPFSRRHIMNLWQESDLKELGGLDPCCFQTIWSVTELNGVKKLHMKLDQRSSDYIVAGHINKMQYVALQMMVAREIGAELGTFTHSVANLHIYDRHISVALEILGRFQSHYSKPANHKKLNQPSLVYREGAELSTAMPKDFAMLNYQHMGELSTKLEMAI